jgi:ferredoxin-NADP reductase
MSEPSNPTPSTATATATTSTESADSGHHATRRVHTFETVVSDVIRETADATTLVLVPTGSAPSYRAGQFLTIDPHQFPALHGFTHFLEEQKGKRELVRAYSVSSSPHEKRIAFTIKVEPYLPGVTKYPPLLSPWLTYGVERGSTMEVTGFTGAYTFAHDIESRVDTVLHVVAGSGSVPNLSLLKWDLETNSKLKHVFVYSNKAHADIIFREQLDSLRRRFPERLKLVHMLTRELPHPYGPDYRAGRISLELLRELIPSPERVEAYVCGAGITIHQRKEALAKGEKPAPRFLECMVDLLGQLGLNRKQIHQEAFG